MKEVIINTGAGNLTNGFASVSVELKDRGGGSFVWRRETTLNPAPQLLLLLEQWRHFCDGFLYTRSINDSRSSIFEAHGNHISNYSNQDLRQLRDSLKQEVNNWLDCRENFGREVGDELRNYLSDRDEILVIIVSNDSSIWQLPWYLWDFLTQHPRSVEVFYHSNYENTTKFRPTQKERVDILALFGEDSHLQFDRDSTTLQGKLPKANVIARNPTSLRDFANEITQSKAPILFFSGHGRTIDEQSVGYIALNKNLEIEIRRLKETLMEAVKNGLQIAIFNCCSGLGLAKQLREVNIPCTIVMRDKIDDSIARQFLLDLMTRYSQDKTFYNAFIYARNQLRLNSGENFASIDEYLPVLVINPLSRIPAWQDLIISISAPSETITTNLPTRSRAGLLEKFAVPISLSLGMSLSSTILIELGLKVFPQIQTIEDTVILDPVQRFQALRANNRSSEVVIVTLKNDDFAFDTFNNPNKLKKTINKISSPEGEQKGNTVIPNAWGLEFNLNKPSNEGFPNNLIADCNYLEKDNGERSSNNYPLYRLGCQNSSLALRMLENPLKSKWITRLPLKNLILNKHIGWKMEKLSADKLIKIQEAETIKEKFNQKFIIFVPEDRVNGGGNSDSALALAQIWLSRDGDPDRKDPSIPLLITVSGKDRTIWMIAWASVLAIAMSLWKSKSKFIPLAIIPVQIVVGGGLMISNGDIFPIITTAIAMLVTWAVALANEKWRSDREERENDRS